MSKPKTLIWDCELKPNIVSAWSLFKPVIGINQVIEPARLICFAWRWHGEKTTKFSSEWDDTYSGMIRKLHDLFSEADVVAGFNSNSFDNKHANAAFLLEGLAPPSPYKQVDLYREARKHFNLASRKLDFIVQELGIGAKTPHSGMNLWNEVVRPSSDESGAKHRALMKKYCLTPDHKVLTTELRWKEIGDLEIGEDILGFDEHVNEYGRRWRRSKVLSNERMIDDVYLVTMSNGDKIKCTAEHRWLTCAAGREGGARWVRTFAPKELNNGVPGLHSADKYPRNKSNICKYFNVTEEILDKDAGWLAGIFDGEGTLSNRVSPHDDSLGSGLGISASQKKGPELDRIYELLDRYGISHASQRHGKDEMAIKSNGKIKSSLPIDIVRVKGGFYSCLDFLLRIRPQRLIDKLNWDSLPRMERRTGWTEVVHVESVEHIGRQEVVVLETSTGTFIADGYPMHNCKNDVDLTVELYDRLLPWLNPGVCAGLLSEDELVCTNCGSGEVHRRGWAYTTAGRYRRFQCQSCLRWLRSARSDRVSELRPA